MTDYAIEHALREAGLELRPREMPKKELAKALIDYFAVVYMADAPKHAVSD